MTKDEYERLQGSIPVETAIAAELGHWASLHEGLARGEHAASEDVKHELHEMDDTPAQQGKKTAH